MLVYEKDEFVERDDLALVFDEIFDKHPDDYGAALLAAGFYKVSRYYPDNDTHGLGIEVCLREDDKASILSAEYEFLVELGVGGGMIKDVLIKNAGDLYNFLEKYLPTVKLAGTLLVND